MAVEAKASSTIWNQAATTLGWRHSPAHDGWISDAHVGHGQYGEGGHASGVSAEDACFLDGIETLDQAVAVLD